ETAQMKRQENCQMKCRDCQEAGDCMMKRVQETARVQEGRRKRAETAQKDGQETGQEEGCQMKRAGRLQEKRMPLQAPNAEELASAGDLTSENVLPSGNSCMDSASRGALCLDWDRAWLESYQPGLNTGWDFRIQLADLQTAAQTGSATPWCTLPLAELLPPNFGSSGGGSPLLYEFFLAPSGKVANFSGIKDKQGAMVLGHAKHQASLRSFLRPPTVAEFHCYPPLRSGTETNCRCRLEITASLFTAASDLDADCPFRWTTMPTASVGTESVTSGPTATPGADEEVSFCSEIRQQKTDSAIPTRSAQPGSRALCGGCLGISIAIVILLALVLIQTALLRNWRTNPAPPPVVLSQQRLFEQQQLRRLRQLAGAVPPPPFRQPPHHFAGGAPEDSGGEFDVPMPVPAQAGVAQQRPRLEDSGFSGDDLGRCRMAPLGLSQFRSSACVPRLPNRRISPPPQSSRGQKKSSR
uniref:CUB domain-containing protein n=1 Tax=Macrostomum lignano TaxID=282301 RepID=A0A1I8F9D7_9PLAT